MRKREKNTRETIVSLNTLVGGKTRIEGDVYAVGALKVDGEIKGNVSSDGDVIIGEEGVVNGSVLCKNILISGMVIGNVNVSGQLSLAATARTRGDLRAHSLVIADGAKFIGTCTTMEDDVSESVLEKRSVEIPKLSENIDDLDDVDAI